MIPVWTMCTPQMRSAIAPARSTKVKVVSILHAPASMQSASALITLAVRRSEHHEPRQNRLIASIAHNEKPRVVNTVASACPMLNGGHSVNLLM
jgi:thiazole synthase ThiGH ThiG subunit